MFCRQCGDELFQEETAELIGGEVSFVCSECEWIYVFEEDEDGHLKEIEDFPI